MSTKRYLSYLLKQTSGNKHKTTFPTRLPTLPRLSTRAISYMRNFKVLIRFLNINIAPFGGPISSLVNCDNLCLSRTYLFHLCCQIYCYKAEIFFIFLLISVVVACPLLLIWVVLFFILFFIFLIQFYY